MLIQHREHTYRLIRQHDHALLAGALALAWRTADGETLAPRTTLATALHDAVWIEEDQLPRLDPATGAPHDFTTIPAETKRAFVERGVVSLASVEPAVAELVGAHHRALAEGAPVDPGTALAWVRFFDNLSLFICLTPPGTTTHPRWLSWRTLDAPDGAALSLAWAGPDSLTIAPYAFGAPATVTLPFRDLPRRRFESQEDLNHAWEHAPEQQWSVVLTWGH
jgi:hypothetical protein